MQMKEYLAQKTFKGCTIWFTGLPCSGKTTLATALCKHLETSYGCASYNIDGDILRTGLNNSLGFNDADRNENIRRAAEVAKMMAEAGLICVVSTISPFEKGRQHARHIHNIAGINFFEIYLSTPLETCQCRDVKGLYEKAKKSEIQGLTGIDAVYENPINHDLQIDTTDLSIDECIAAIMKIIFVDMCLSNQTSSIQGQKSLLNGDSDCYRIEHDYFEKTTEQNNEGRLRIPIPLLSNINDNLVSADSINFNQNKIKSLTNQNHHTATLKISKIDAQWIQTIMDGWAYPLTGFMCEKDYLECLHFRTITREKCKFSQSLPIILSCTDLEKKDLEQSIYIDLLYNDQRVAVLVNPDFYPFRKEEHCARIFGTTDNNHPSIKNIMKCGPWLIGGSLEHYNCPKWNDGFDEYRLNVRELRQRIKSMNDKVDSIVAFQVRNPLHNGHVLLINEALNKLSEEGYRQTIILLHPLGGWTKDDDVPLGVRIKQHEVYIKELGWAKNTVLAIFPSPMLYAGPVEVQWHAKARSIVGITHYIVGRDPAGIPHPNGGDLYDPTHGVKVLSLMNSLLPLKILSFPVAALCKLTRKMTFFDPKRKDDFEFISGTLMRAYARAKQNPPSGFMNSEAWNVLAEYYGNKS